MELKVENIQKQFGKAGLAKTEFTLKQGDFLCIVGESGCGKTTLLNIISGMLRPDSGNVFLDGRDIYRDLREPERTGMRNTFVGYMMQGNALIPDFTVRQNIVCPIELNGKKADHSKITGLARKLRIEKVMDSYPSELSGGEYRRVLLARVLLLDTPILVVDEPTSNLDERSAVIVRNVLHEAHVRGKSLIVVTHDRAFFQYDPQILELH